jgi:hypothetical protein
MKKIIGIVLAAVCLLGCKQGKKELHDPLLRQQLTTIVSSLNVEDRSSADKAESDLNAILSVNSKKMSELQKSELENAVMTLELAEHNYYLSNLYKIGNVNSPEASENAKQLQERVSKAKDQISDAAATF